MPNKLAFEQFTKEDFESFIFSRYTAFSVHWSFYKYNWHILHTECREVPRNKEINEYVYIIQLTHHFGILVYSGIDQTTGQSRSAGGDAIRLVPVKLYYFDPIHKKEQRVNRIKTWKSNFEKRVNQIQHQLFI